MLFAEIGKGLHIACLKNGTGLPHRFASHPGIGEGIRGYANN